MRRSVNRCGVYLAVLLLYGEAQLAQASDGAGLRPYIGETLQDFEARRNGLQLGHSKDSTGVLTIAADEQGHFFVESTVGRERIRMLVDTGASLVALSHEDAERVPIRVSRKDYTIQMGTANGLVEAAPVRIPEIKVGNIVVRNVEAVVLPPGRLNTSLLGMTFLRRLSAFEISEGRLALRQ